MTASKNLYDQIAKDTQFQKHVALASQFEASRTYQQEPLGLDTYERPLFNPRYLFAERGCCCPCHREHEEEGESEDE